MQEQITNKNAEMKKVELLAPAGNFDALRGAIKAGADAVYLGGERYGARAYADNFSEEEICAGIRMAHVFGVKVYLTVNTLVKEKELNGLYDFLLPFYVSGLDGVIVQDLGALRFIREHFKGLKLCASTQMTITGSKGAALMKSEGCEQIVPARELSLEEMKNIKDCTGVEIETFIHGAMCYCYSGQCLLSSILGGRSGNRGRCAQPCRLPYSVDQGKTCYPLSMRDMCTLSILPELIEAGIDSFKIEGRMKKPAYAAGVTAVYRKYIDMYYNDKESYHVAKEDLERLRALYIRSEIGEGYYHRHNGKDMITLSSPAYLPTDEKILEDINDMYVNPVLNQKVSAKIYLKAGEPAKLILNKEKIEITSFGEIVQEAMKQPLTEEKIREQILKSGNTFLDIENVEVYMEGAVFMAVRSVNNLRRQAIAAMEQEIITHNGLSYAQRKEFLQELRSKNFPVREKKSQTYLPKQIQVSVRTRNQLLTALREQPDRIYVESSLIVEDILQILREYAKTNQTKFYLATPYIIRKKDGKYLKEMKEILSDSLFEGALLRNIESFQYFIEENLAKKMVLDANFYILNRESLYFFENRADEFFLPLECNVHEWKELLENVETKIITPSMIVYGRLPMMISANCLNKTMGKCHQTSGIATLTDRYEKQFPVYTDCRYCYNIIYNSVPLSLHRIFEKDNPMVANFRLDFTIEDEKQTADVIRYFKGLTQHYTEPAYKAYTTGHYKRGVE